MNHTGKSARLKVVPSSSIEDLDESLLTEILQRLPTCKFAHQCKLVSKHWLSLISSPLFSSCFKKYHETLHSKEPAPFTVIMFGSPSPASWFTSIRISESPAIPFCIFDLNFLPFYNPEVLSSSPVVEASCKDLILCRQYLRDDDQRVYYVCNPLTKDWVAIPPISCKHKETTGKGDTIVGFVCAEKDFRVIRIHKLELLATSFIAEIFSSEKNEWIGQEVSYSYDYFFDSCFSWNTNGKLILSHHQTESVVSYSPWEPDQCHIIDTPRLPWSGHPSLLGRNTESKAFGICKGSLRVLQVFYVGEPDDHRFLRVLELEDYEKGAWRLAGEVCLASPSHHNGGLRRFLHSRLRPIFSINS
ncbi:hypothetical protein Tsubulata_040914, partial [Turnera subulata]